MAEWKLQRTKRFLSLGRGAGVLLGIFGGVEAMRLILDFQGGGMMKWAGPRTCNPDVLG